MDAQNSVDILEPPSTLGPPPLDYLRAAANHALATGDATALSQPMELTGAIGKGIGAGAGLAAGAAIGSAIAPGLGTVIGGIVGAVTGYDWRVTAATTVSATNQLYNSAVALTNVIPGVDAEQADIHAWMGGNDSDLSRYYDANKVGIDTAGFVVSSIPAGLGALKVYNAGAKMLGATAAAGELGIGTSEATGLLIPRQTAAFKAAQAAALENSNTFNALNAGFLKAAAYGAGEQAIQGLVFEAGVQTLLNKSPLLDGQDALDITHNLYTGAWVSGLVGGIAGGIGMASRIGKALGLADEKLMGAKFQEGSTIGSAKHEEIAMSFDNQANLDTAPVTGDEALTKLKSQTQTRANNAIDDNRRLLWKDMAVGGDEVAANQMHELTDMIWLKAGKSTDAVRNFVDGVVSIGRKGSTSAVEADVAKVQAKINKGVKIDDLPAGEVSLLDRYSTKFINTWGEQLGEITTAAKDHVDLWAALTKAGQTVSIRDKVVQAGDKLFKVDFHKQVDYRTLEDVSAANARNLYALKTGAQIKDGITIHPYDIGALEKAHKDFGSTLLTSVKVGDDVITSAADLEPLLVQAKLEVAATHIANGKLSEAAIASLTNVKQSRINGTAVNEADGLSDFLAMQTFEKEFLDAHQGVKLSNTGKEPLLAPNQLKVIMDTSLVEKDAALAVPFMAGIKAHQKVLEQAARTAVAHVLGPELFGQMIELPADLLRKVTRAGAGSGKFQAANSELGSAGAIFERMGQVHDRAFTVSKNAVNEALNTHIQKLFNNTAAQADYVQAMHQVGNTGEKYVVSATERKLVHREYQEFLDGIREDMPRIPDGVKLEIPLQTDEAFNLIKAHTAVNDARITKFSGIRALGANGKLIEPGTVYAPPVNLRDYQYYAFVTDSHQVTGTGANAMIWAHSPEQLEAKLALIPEEFQAGIIRKPTASTAKETERWQKATGQYERDDALTDNYFKSALNRKGTAVEYLPATKADKIRDQLLDWHYRQERNLLDESFGAFYSKEFDTLSKLGELWADKALSRVGSNRPGELVKANTHNPYLSHIRTALNMPNTDKIPYKAFQDWADKQTSEIWNSAKESINGAAKTEDLDIINKAFQDAGINTVNYDSVAYALANSDVPRGTLSLITRRANAIIAGIGLGWDALNALNNRVGSLIMLAPETEFVLSKIRSGDEALVGALKDIAHVTIPGTSHDYLSTPKLIANAIKMSWQPEMRAWAASKGFSIRHMQDVEDIIDTIALRPDGKATDMIERLDVGFHKLMRFNKKAATLTGNAHAEEYTRLTSALVMKQLTDLAVQGGHMTERVADSYIQTFVNRTNGIYLASQRPMMFNGPVGQAMGLYQTYTTTMMSNFFRYVNNGAQKSAALMMAAQGSIYGMSGLPAFQAINTHLVGAAAGNTDHTDMYSRAYASMDKSAAEWLMFGALSNTLGLLHPDLKMNMYTRGDVSPRNISIVPLNPFDFPAVAIAGKFFGNLADMGSNVAAGAPIGNTFLRGLEHNAISRPLSGLAQVLEGFGPTGKAYGTTQSGKLVSANDIWSMHSITRLAGAKKLDDAVSMDETYRTTVYKAKDSDNIQKIGEALRMKMIGGQELSQEDFHAFQEDYVKAGGNQKGFNRYITRLQRESSYSNANRISIFLKTPESADMQRLMGGITANDFMISEQD